MSPQTQFIQEGLDESMIISGLQGKYYVVNGYKYDVHFPIGWATSPDVYFHNERYQTGPEYCCNCFEHGSRNGVFIGYCYNCGFIHHSRRNFLEYDAVSITTNERLWKELPYLNGVDIDDIGDSERQIIGCDVYDEAYDGHDDGHDDEPDDEHDDHDYDDYNYNDYSDEEHDDYDEDEEDKREEREYYEIFGFRQ